jgi:predicted metalloprotease
MRWRDREESENVEDRRDEPASGRRFPFPFPGGGGGEDGGGYPRGIPIPGGTGGGLGIVGVLIVLALAYFLGIDPRVILDQGGDSGGGGISLPRSEAPPRQASQPLSAEEQELRKFTAVVLKTTEDVWKDEFQRTGKTYTPPKLVLFRDEVESACGEGMSQAGPFYCPLDGRVYVDMSFYSDLKTRFKAPGDFAQAYVVAHEVGHHVQTLLGITDKVMRARSNASEAENNALQVKMELQADCFAGVWANRAQKKLDVVENGDIEDALNAAAAIGDDRIQRRTQGRVVPESFTHGSSQQRVTWFKRGFDGGEIKGCDTFGTGGV